MAHQHMFSSTTPAGTLSTVAATGEPVVLVEHSQHTTITTVNYNHTGMILNLLGRIAKSG